MTLPMVRFLFLVALALGPGASVFSTVAEAGAWAREEGTVFISLSYNVPTDGAHPEEGTVSAYVEYGLPWRLTAGANLDQRPVGPHSLELFLRRNINAPNATWQVALEAGFEMALDAHIDEFTGQISYLAEPGQPAFALHLGRGLASRFGNGWLDVRLGANLATKDAPYRGEVDATLGLNLTDRFFGTLEVWHDYSRDGSFTSVVPGVGFRVTDRIAGTFRYIHEMDDQVADSVEIGTWLEF